MFLDASDRLFPTTSAKRFPNYFPVANGGKIDSGQTSEKFDRFCYSSDLETSYKPDPVPKICLCSHEMASSINPLLTLNWDSSLQYRLHMLPK